jgi:hypothetical protein
VSIDFQLTLAGAISAHEVAECAFPDPVERPTPAEGSGERLSAVLYKRYGLALSVWSGSDGYCDAEDDDGVRWEWEPATYLNVVFHMDKEMIDEKGFSGVLTIVARVLACCPADVALVFNGDVLLLTRVDGRTRKHHRLEWWDANDTASDIIPD